MKAYKMTSVLILMFGLQSVSGQNPLILDQFTADPSARVFEGKVYVYPSHDIPCGPGQGIIGFCMKDYHVYSSENLTDWKDHGVIVSQEKVPWVDSTSYTMWAPDCIYRDGRYYFYFPARMRDIEDKGPMAWIGVAISDKPYGPFIPEQKPMPGVYGIDPNPFIDKDGQAYLYWAGMGGLHMAKLKDNMLELESEPTLVEGLPDGFKEGPYLFERNGIYYFTFPHVVDSTERLSYCTAGSPAGPFKYGGMIMNESPVDCWTNHQSIIEYKGQWYLFYHHNDLSPEFDKNRSILADSLFFNEDGSIKEVKRTRRGVGLTSATNKIQIDRYSAISEKPVCIDYLDSLQKQKGWKVIFNSDNGWVKYGAVDFVKGSIKSVSVNALAEKGGIIEIRMDDNEGQVIAKIDVPENSDWGITNTLIDPDIELTGTHDLYVHSKLPGNLEIDWIRFE